MPSAEALARVRAGRNPLYRALTAEDPDDRLALAPLLEARDDDAVRLAVDGLSLDVLTRHLADVAAIVELDDPWLAGRALGRLYGR